MRYVLDASIAVKWVLPESDSALALALRDGFLKHTHELMAPDIFPVEVAHALTRAERKGIISQSEAAVKLADVLSTAPLLYPHLSLLARAVDLSSQTRVGVYDCIYIALAEQESCELVTADVKLRQALRGHPIIELSAIP